MPRALFPALVLLVGALPAATAWAAAPVEGALAFDGPVGLSGRIEATSPEGVLDLTGLAMAGKAPALRADAVAGWVVMRNWTTVRGPQGPVSLAPDLAQNASLRHGASRVEGIACGEGCLVVAFGLGGEGTRVGVARAASERLAWLAEAEHVWAESSGEDARDAFHVELPPGTYALDAADGALVLEGRVGILARGARLLVAEGDETRVVDARTQRTNAGDPLGLASVAQARSGFIYLELEGAALAAPATGPARLAFREGTLRLEGVLDAARATGTLEAGRATLRLMDDPLRLEGAVALALESLEPPGRGLPLDAQASPTVRGHLAGDATVTLAGARVLPAAAPPASFWAQLAALALLAAAALGQRAGVQLGLYTRIARASVLENPTRRLVLDRVRAAPGATAADLSRATTLGRVLVQYHLRMLHANALVVHRTDGRQVRWFVPEAALPPDEIALAQALGEEKRRRIAACVLAAPEPGLTQRELARRAEVSPRLASYHLARLESSGLVRGVGSRPARYVPTPRLETELGAADGRQATDA